MIEHVDYKFVEKATSDFYSVKLLTGKFAGVIYTYGLVKLQENLESDSLTVQFDYKIEDKHIFTISFLVSIFIPRTRGVHLVQLSHNRVRMSNRPLIFLSVCLC